MNIELAQILKIIDDYARLVLSSWPAVIFILSVFILFRHKEAIDDRIRNIEHVGREGIKFSQTVPIPKSDREPTQSFIKAIIDKFISFFRQPVPSKDSVALVEYKIASSLPGTVTFDFLRDWKVWFWIGNREPKRYRAYVKIKFMADGYEEEIKEGYYGGTTPWNLNAFSGIQAPGLGIPDKIKEAANEKKKIKVEINCTVKDENDNLVEEKLPSVYAYEYENKYWYLEP